MVGIITDAQKDWTYVMGEKDPFYKQRTFSPFWLKPNYSCSNSQIEYRHEIDPQWSEEQFSFNSATLQFKIEYDSAEFEGHYVVDMIGYIDREEPWSTVYFSVSYNLHIYHQCNYPGTLLTNFEE